MSFVNETIQKLVADGTMQPTDSVLTICAGRREHENFQRNGFTKVTISNLDERVAPEEFAPYDWSRQDAGSLTYEDHSFDFCFVNAGLHHCDSPHRALLEMYRVARKGVIVLESRDSVTMRCAAMFNFVCTYELEAVILNDFKCGGVNNTNVPNYVYRWTEREFEKTINTHNPTGKHRFQYFYGLLLPHLFIGMSKNPLKKLAYYCILPFVFLLTKLFKKQMNQFAMIAIKPRIPADIWPWLVKSGDTWQLDRDFAQTKYRV